MDRERLFEQILSQHALALWRIARSYAGKAGDEQDLHQEILLQLWRGLVSFRGEAALGTWVYRVALNTALTSRRRMRRRERVEVVTEHSPEAAALHSGGLSSSSVAVLEDFLAGLGEIDRSVMLLYVEGLSHEEIGQVTGLSRGAAAVRLHRLKQRFVERYLEG